MRKGFRTQLHIATDLVYGDRPFPPVIGALVLGLLLWALPALAATAPAAAAKKAPLPTYQPMTAAYTIPDEGRDPFFPTSDQFRKKDEIVLPADPTARDLLTLVNITGLMGKPEDPEAAGVLVKDKLETKLYRVGQSIPVRFGSSAYQLVLVGVQFPGQVLLKYKDETVTLAVGSNKKNGE